MDVNLMAVETPCHHKICPAQQTSLYLMTVVFTWLCSLSAWASSYCIGINNFEFKTNIRILQVSEKTSVTKADNAEFRLSATENTTH